jgi:transcriptional regulator of acetoin/glycerol metabolism
VGCLTLRVPNVGFGTYLQPWQARVQNSIFRLTALSTFDLTARRHNLNAAERTKFILFLSSQCSDNRKLPSEISQKAAAKFGIALCTVSRVWFRYCKQGLDGALFSARGNSGRKRIEIDMEALQQIQYVKRGTVRSTAKSLGIPKSTLQNHIKYAIY